VAPEASHHHTVHSFLELGILHEPQGNHKTILLEIHLHILPQEARCTWVMLGSEAHTLAFLRNAANAINMEVNTITCMS
jgi:hypothetical protein